MPTSSLSDEFFIGGKIERRNRALGKQQFFKCRAGENKIGAIPGIFPFPLSGIQFVPIYEIRVTFFQS